MNKDSFKNMTVYIGRGTNDFTMSRGSFNYREKIKAKRRLEPVLRNATADPKDGIPDFEVQIYRDPKTGDEYEFKLEVSAEGRAHMWLDDSFRKHKDSGINRYWIELPTARGEHYYGCGETFSEFDLKGQKVRIWTAEHQNSRRISKKVIRDRFTGKHPDRKLPFDRYESYYVQPTFTGVLPGECGHGAEPYYMHVNTSAYCTFDFKKDGLIRLYLQETPDIYMEKAASFEDFSAGLSGLLGKQKELPDWIYDGVILASQEGTESIEKKIALAEKYNIPLIGFWSQDWCGCRRTGFGYQVMWNWEWNSELYKDLDRKIPEWRHKGIRFLGYINTFLALEKDLYKYAAAHGYCVKDKEGNDYLVTITTFPAAMIDLTNRDAWNWYKEVIRTNMIEFGLSGWMADFGEYLPTDCVLSDGSDPEKRHNEWPALWAKLNHEALEESGCEKDIFFFTRAGFTETIKYSTMMWNGDQHVDFSVDDGIGSVIPATLSLAMSGYGITHSDVGGYTTIMNMTRNRELLMRWEEMNVFSPLMRFHEGNQPSRNVQFDADEELLEHLAVCGRIHVQLKDYIRACVSEAAAGGIPVMRPVFYHYDEDWAYGEATEYLLGRDVLVAPVLKEGLKSRKVKLPADKWVHFFTGKVYDGGDFEIEAPIGRPPVFVRRDSDWAERLLKIAESV